MKLEDLYEKVIKENYQAKPGMAVEVYLRRSGNFQQEKMQLAKQIAQTFKQQMGLSVRPFGDTLQNGSSVLELTVPYEADVAGQESVPDTSDYEQVLHGLGLEHFSLYPA